MKMENRKDYLLFWCWLLTGILIAPRALGRRLSHKIGGLQKQLDTLVKPPYALCTAPPRPVYTAESAETEALLDNNAIRSFSPY